MRDETAREHGTGQGSATTSHQPTPRTKPRKRQRASDNYHNLAAILMSSIIFSQALLSQWTCHAFHSPVVPGKSRHRSWASQSSSFDLDQLPFDDSTYQQYSSASSKSRSFAGLSKFHRSILSRTQTRQRFVTGRYPLTIRIIHDNPTRSWLKKQGTELLVNDTAPLKSLASFDRFLWLDNEERTHLQRTYNMVSLELIAEIYCERPAYVQTIRRNAATGDQEKSTLGYLQNDDAFSRPPWSRTEASPYTLGSDIDAETLWITGFSLTGRKGVLKSVDCETGSMGTINSRTERILQWPNEVVAVPDQIINSTSNTRHQDALLVCDGFLVPGKDRGGLRIIKHPGDSRREWTVSLTPTARHRWFYHRATWMDLTGDGRLSLLAARCQVSVASRENGGVTSGISKTGQLVWLECPVPHTIDPDTGTPLDIDGTVFDPFGARHTPWKTRVLAEGPDVMFCVADLDPDDDTLEVFSSQFFGKQVSLHSIQKGPKPRITFERVIDDQCGSAFGSILADLDGSATETASTRVARVVDVGSTVGTLNPGDSFSHLLVTSHECTYAETDKRSTTQLAGTNEGGSLFAYRVPQGVGAWKTQPWVRTEIASGFKVNGQLSNMINPGAPGLLYTFHAKIQDKALGKRPLIAVAGDCAESAYIFRPEAGDSQLSSTSTSDDSARYQLMVEIKCESTVGSIGVGYDDFTADMAQESGHAKLFIPCHEKDKILVFALGSGTDETDDGW